MPAVIVGHTNVWDYAQLAHIVQQKGYAMDFYPINTNKAALLALFMIFSLMT